MMLASDSDDHWLLPKEAALGLLPPADVLDLERGGLDRGEGSAVWPATTDRSSYEMRFGEDELAGMIRWIPEMKVTTTPQSTDK
jgi:hypothetical protein